MGLFTLLAHCRAPFRRRRAAARAEAAPLAPRRLERRRVLDAAGAGLVLGPLAGTGEFVQAGTLAGEENALPPNTESPGAANLVIPNTPPTISDVLAFPDSAVEGGAPIDLLVLFGDLDGADTHTVEIDWGDGTPLEVIAVDPGLRFLFTSHQFQDDNPTGTPLDVTQVDVTVKDNRGGMAMGSTQVTVSNVAPLVVLDPVTMINEDGAATLTGTITDPGSLDTFTLNVDWGDPLSPDNLQTFALGATPLTA
ncbi:MAG: hypothetical protein MI725_04700, partial [Pirellulales bacterium]|nr:hypothetical protein [Pirellulales bacterium]